MAHQKKIGILYKEFLAHFLVKIQNEFADIRLY